MKRTHLLKFEFTSDEIERLLLGLAGSHVSATNVRQWSLRWQDDGSALVHAVLADSDADVPR